MTEAERTWCPECGEDFEFPVTRLVVDSSFFSGIIYKDFDLECPHCGAVSTHEADEEEYLYVQPKLR